jgi:hypothetical protein
MFLLTFCCFWVVVSWELVGLSCGGDFCFWSESLLVDIYVFGVSSASTSSTSSWGLTKVWIRLHLPSFGMLPISIYAAQSLAFVQGIEDREFIDSKRVDKTLIYCLVFGIFLSHFHATDFIIGLLLGSHPLELVLFLETQIYLREFISERLGSANQNF